MTALEDLVPDGIAAADWTSADHMLVAFEVLRCWNQVPPTFGEVTLVWRRQVCAAFARHGATPHRRVPYGTSRFTGHAVLRRLIDAGLLEETKWKSPRSLRVTAAGHRRLQQLLGRPIRIEPIPEAR
jgi:hypothetical protein